MCDDNKLLDRFMKKVMLPDSSSGTECWIWIGGKSGGGYGMMRDENGNKCLAHRMSYRLFYDEIPNGMSVLHHCDNRPCVNPLHLFLGDRSDNMKDMWNKNRHPTINMGRPSSTMIGENNVNSKLSKEDVLQIRDLYEKKSFSQSQLASMFEVETPAIWKIIHRRTWKYV